MLQKYFVFHQNTVVSLTNVLIVEEKIVKPIVIDKIDHIEELRCLQRIYQRKHCCCQPNMLLIETFVM
jgi:hypothetical protein